MAIQSNYLEAAVADAILSRSTTIPSPGTLYFALFLAMPDENGLNGQEVPSSNGTGYSRKAVSNTAAEFPATPMCNKEVDGHVTDVKGVKNNVSTGSGSISFPPAVTDWGDVVGFGIYDAPTGGNLLISSALDTARTVARNDTMRFVDRELKFTEFNQTPDNILSFFMQRVVLDSLFGRTATYANSSVSDVYFSLFNKMPAPDELGYAVPVMCNGVNGHADQLRVPSTTGLVPGMTVTDLAGTRATGDNPPLLIPVNAKVKTVNPGSTPTVTLDCNTGGEVTDLRLVFSNEASHFDGGREVGGNCTVAAGLQTGSTSLSLVENSSIVVGMAVTGNGIQPGTTVKSKGSTTVEILPAATATMAASMLTFSNPSTGYQRVPLANTATNFSPYANGLKTNATQVVWPVCLQAWSGVTGLGIHDAAAGGNLLFKIPFASIRNFVVGEQPRLASNALSIYLD